MTKVTVNQYPLKEERISVGKLYIGIDSLVVLCTETTDICGYFKGVVIDHPNYPKVMGITDMYYAGNFTEFEGKIEIEQIKDV